MAETVFPKPLDQEVASINAHLGSLVKNTGNVTVTTDASGNAPLQSVLPSGAIPLYATGTGGYICNGTYNIDWGILPYIVGDSRKSQTITVKIYYLQT